MPPTLWLGNACTEHMVDRMDLLTEADYRGILFAMKRLTWLLRDHDVLVIPRPVTQDFLEYVTRHTGTDPATLRVISPDAPLLTHQELRTSKVSVTLQELTPESLEYQPYIHDRGAVTFAQHIGLDDANASNSFLVEGGAELLNSKVVFRALAAGAGVPVPAGMPCRTSGDLVHAVKRLLPRTGSVIMKRDRAVGGHGNLVITTNEDVHAVGAMETLHVTDTCDLTELVTAAGLAETFAPMGEVVVEEFLPDCRSVYAEVRCPLPPEEPQILNTGSLRTGEDPPVLAGLELPLADVSDDVGKVFADGALRLARLMQTLGYQGLASIDAVISPDGRQHPPRRHRHSASRQELGRRPCASEPVQRPRTALHHARRRLDTQRSCVGQRSARGSGDRLRRHRGQRHCRVRRTGAHLVAVSGAGGRAPCLPGRERAA